MSDHKTVLHPEYNSEIKSLSILSSGLVGIGFLGTNFRDGLYTAGNKFLEWVNIDKDVSRDKEYLYSRCGIELIGIDDYPYFLGADNVHAPGCPVCSFPVERAIEDWIGKIDDWDSKIPVVFDCPKCNTSTLLPNLNWHHTGGFAR